MNVSSSGKLGIYIRSIRAMRTMHWILMVFLGFIIRPDSLSFADFIVPAVAVVFLWQYTTMINDIYDLDIDRKAHPDRALVRGEISVGEYRKMAIFSLALSMLISVMAGPILLLVNLLFFILAVLYSKPPVRIRNRWYGTTVMGAASALEVSAGYFSHYWISDLSFFYITQVTPLFTGIALIVLFALTVAPNITAYKDYEGDMEAGAKTIYTILGKERGKRLVSGMLFILFILPALLFPTAANFIISLSLGALAFISFLTFECDRCVFFLYFMELLYFIAYFSGFTA